MANLVDESVSEGETEYEQGHSSGNGSDCGEGYVSEDMFAKDSETDENDDSCGEPDSEPNVDDREEKSPKRRKLVQTPPIPRGNSVVKSSSVPARRPTPTLLSHVSKGRSLNHTPKTHFSSTRPKTLNMDKSPAGGESYGNLSSVLGEITNMLGTVIERLDKTESKLDSMERQLKTPSSSAASGSDGKRTVLTVVRTEMRKTYKALLDGDEFTGFDLSPQTTYRDKLNRDVTDLLVKEVRSHNPTFLAADIRAAAYTYHTSLCQEDASKRKGIYAQKKIKRRRRERVVQRRAERESQFSKMSYNEADRMKWKKILVTDMMSSDESGTEDGHSVFIVKELRWRSDKVTAFFQRLDKARDHRKTEQASRQTKSRIRNGAMSTRPAPSGFPLWAVCN